MEIKSKPCKGIGKANGVKGCGNDFKHRTYGLCNSCLSDFLFDTDAGKLIMQKRVIPKAKIKIKSESKAKDRETREKLKTLSEYEAEAKKAFQKYIRLRDKDLPCISCGNSKTNDWAGGHYFAAGIYSGLMFDERNCHKQCNTNCNKYLSGNLLEYRRGIILRFGQDFITQLENDANRLRNYKYTKQELIDKKKEYELKIKSL